MLKKFVLLLGIISVAFTLKAQELNCNLVVNSDQIQGSNKSVFNTLQKSASDFINNRSWTELSFEQDEKIECTMTLIV